MIKVAILTVSDSCSQGKSQDVSGPTIAEMLSKDEFVICQKKIVADDMDEIAGALTNFCDKRRR